jgi:hypothetical protein
MAKSVEIQRNPQFGANGVVAEPTHELHAQSNHRPAAGQRPIDGREGIVGSDSACDDGARG